jgi:hypothetical protein
MNDQNDLPLCRNCGSAGTGKFCSQCGQPYIVKRISLQSLLHDAFHLFTHFDKGFAYTLKALVLAPGHMQRSYIEGERSRHQKPFSMFFLCATVAALSRYWIFEALLKYYHSGNVSEANYFHEYMVLLHVALVPLYTLLTYLLFRKSGYNYAEIGVLILYLISFVFIVSILISLLKFIWPDLDTAYIELPLFCIYNAVTFVNLFHNTPRWSVIAKSTIAIIAIFLLIQVAEDYIVQRIS